MEIQGEDYVYLTNVEPGKVEPIFLKKLREHWPSPLIQTFDRTNGHIWLHIAKDEEMYHFNEEHGASLNENGEGCFMLLAGHESLLQADVQISNVYLNGAHYNVAPHDAKLILINRWEYTLVLPALIEESEFARKIHEYLMETISDVCRGELAK
ncbi:MAG TPA: hypothetical protein VI685_26305 [Candidatus Angelobacter sp.]